MATINVKDASGSTVSIFSPDAAPARESGGNLEAILAKIIASPATAANQSTEITVLNQLHTDLTAATPAGEFHIGAIGGNSVAAAPSFAPTVQAAAYSAGNVIGGLQTLNNVARVNGGTGVILTADIFLKIANTAALDLLVFHDNPTSSTFTDKTGLSVAAADVSKLSGVIHVADWTNLGSASIGQATNIGMAFKCVTGASGFGQIPTS